MWSLSFKADRPAREIADRHYNRQKVGAVQFMPPGKTLVLIADGAVWGTSWPLAQYVRHAWAGAWVNSLFRKECGGSASAFIRSAIAATRYEWPDVPALGMVTFVDPAKVHGIRRRAHACNVECGERMVFGYCYDRAGFAHDGFTEGGLWAWRMTPEEMPEPEPPIGKQLRIA